MFHVERHPVEKSPPELRPAGNEVMNLWVDNLQRKGLSQNGSPTSALTPNTNL
jgi:hypothetical protein